MKNSKILNRRVGLATVLAVIFLWYWTIYLPDSSFRRLFAKHTSRMISQVEIMSWTDGSNQAIKDDRSILAIEQAFTHSFRPRDFFNALEEQSLKLTRGGPAKISFRNGASVDVVIYMTTDPFKFLIGYPTHSIGDTEFYRIEFNEQVPAQLKKF